ncbi:MAG: tetratricopeptide repeat protein [Thaumarchaeota archaeon]|nr:tetratricopeptide repeat protein [Nitrososphaerota archaeon]
MSEGRRRLAAITFTDIVGFTALAQRDESLALRLLDRHNALLRTIVKEHHGREVKALGDAFLLEFDSALEAVLCAIEIQSSLHEQNRSAANDEKIEVRIGIHVGDVIHRHGDVFGDAVNLASRIMEFAGESGICVSEQVYAQVRSKIHYPMVRLAGQSLKNVEQPMDLYKLVLSKRKDDSPKPSNRPNRVAVLPFENISPDPRDSYFADGLTEEMISVLSELKGLRVIAKTSVNTYKGTTKGVAQIGHDLKVGFVLEGSVRKAGNKIRVNAQLIETESQERVWSSHYDRDLGDIFSIQSDIAKNVADSLEVTLIEGELARMERKETENLVAYVAYLRGRTLLSERTETAIRRAKEQFEIVIREDPGYAKAYSGLADTYIILGDYLFAPVPAALEEAKKQIDKALELDPDLPEARVSLANYLTYDYRFSAAEKEFRRAIGLNPSYATAHHWYAWCLESLGRQREGYAEVMLAEALDPLSLAITMSAVYRCVWSGEFDEARERIRKMEEIDPTSPFIAEARMVYHFAKRDWDNALLYLRKMIDADPTDPYLYSNVAYIYAVTGRRGEALKLVEKLKAVPESSRLKGDLIAFVFVGLNDFDECFKWLEYAYESREAFFGWWRSFPLLDEVRKDPRFGLLLKRAGLPP